MRFYALTFFLSSLVSTFANTSESIDNYYPLGCYFLQDEQYYPIVSVDGKVPLARVNGKAIKVDGVDTRFQRQEVYGEGYIRVSELSAYGVNSNYRSINSTEDAAKVPNQGFVDFELTASTDLKDCYVVVFSGSEDGHAGRNKDEFYVNYKEIGDLKAGKSYKASSPLLFPNSIDADKDIRYFLAFYSEGMPIRSTEDLKIATHFLSKKTAEHQFYMEQYLLNNTGKDLKQTAFDVFTPYLPRALYDCFGPVDVKAVFAINTDGTVQVDQLIGTKDPAVEAFLTSRINEWLFFPSLRDGKAVRTKTATRIAF